MDPLGTQVAVLFVLAIPIACVAWTVTHEEVFREPRDLCVKYSKTCRTLLQRKFFYLFTCEYCFSHWVTALALAITRFQLLYPDWRGYVIALFSLVWVANFYMSVFGRLRLDIREERLEIEDLEGDLAEEKAERAERSEHAKQRAGWRR
jgi:hypothetical protein